MIFLSLFGSNSIPSSQSSCNVLNLLDCNDLLQFHVEALKELLESDDTFGFIIMDGNGALFGTVQGSTREVLHRFSVDLPKKHGRGGQSALRFARLRLEKRHHYVRRVAETAVSLFVTNDKVSRNPFGHDHMTEPLE